MQRWLTEYRRVHAISIFLVLMGGLLAVAESNSNWPLCKDEEPKEIFLFSISSAWSCKHAQGKLNFGSLFAGLFHARCVVR